MLAFIRYLGGNTLSFLHYLGELASLAYETVIIDFHRSAAVAAFFHAIAGGGLPFATGGDGDRRIYRRGVCRADLFSISPARDGYRGGRSGGGLDVS